MRTARLAAMTAALLVLPATAAWAHPSLNPNAVPVGEDVEAVLVVPHGCSTGDGVRPEDGEGVATTRFDLQLVESVTVQPGEVDGWDVEVEEDAVVWTDAGGATTDVIEFPITLRVESGEAGDELAIAAYQECENGDSYQWVQGAEGTPPVALELTEGEPGTVEMDDEDMGHGASETDHSTDDMEDMSSEEATTGESAEQALAGDDADGGNGGTIAAIVAALVVLLGSGGYLMTRRRGTA